MKFIKKEANQAPIVDTVFAIVKKAKEAISEHGSDKVVNSTIGALYDDSEKLVALNSVFDHYNAIDNRTKANYAGSFTGNDSYRKEVYNWVCGSENLDLQQTVIATPGGTGAISMSIECILDKGQTLIIPEIAWGSYALMANENQYNVAKYSMFNDDKFDLDNFKKVCLEVLEKQDKLLVIINDPCHNPTGYSMSQEEWAEVVAFMNECGKKAPCVILNDIAYMDFSYNIANSRKYMQNFNNISEDVLVIIAFSCSKALTSYGLRCGAALVLAQSKEEVRNVEIVFEKFARATWSNIPNAPMENFVYTVTTNLDAYMKEKQIYVDLLNKRSSVFINEAKEVGLPYYPYKEGFFVTLKIEDNQVRDEFHERLMEELIFTVKVNKGIRVAVCSLATDKCYGLAKRMKDILDTIK